MRILIGKCLDEWMVAKDEGKNIKVAPLYFPQYSDQHAPFGVQGNVGVFWGEESWRSAITVKYPIF